MPLFGPPNIDKLVAKYDLPGLIKALNYPKDASIRRRAVYALKQTGDASAVEPLCAALQDDDSDVRWKAAEALAAFHDKRAVDPLLSALGSEDAPTRQRAAELLGGLGDPRAIEPLLALMRKDQAIPSLQAAVTAALIKIDAPRAMQLLASKFNQKKNDVRLAEALNKMGWEPDREAVVPYYLLLNNYEKCAQAGAEAVEPLIARLPDKRAVSALGQIGDSRAVEPLIACQGYFAKNSWDIGIWAATLVRFKNARVVSPLLEIVEEVRKNGGNYNADLACQAVMDALGHMGKLAVEPLMSCRTDGKYRIQTILRAFEKIGAEPTGGSIAIAYWIEHLQWDKCSGPAALEALIAALGEEHATAVRNGAAKKLADLGDQRAIPALVPYLEDYQLGYSAALALGKFGDMRAIRALFFACLGYGSHSGPSAPAWSVVKEDIFNTIVKIGTPAAVKEFEQQTIYWMSATTDGDQWASDFKDLRERASAAIQHSSPPGN
jgi:HEAT repeat protein